MAKMLPPYVDKSCKSNAERKLFTRLQSHPFARDWTILHSLNLSQHVKRQYGEIDFLLLIPHGGIYVMEVKGGDVKCEDGVWYYTNRMGATFKSSVGPFNQARDAMFSLRQAIVRRFGSNHAFTRFLFGFLCAFPDITFDRDSVEYEPWQVLDKDVVNTGLEGFFLNLVDRFKRKHKGNRWFTDESLPSESEINELSQFLRGDFERVRTTQDRLTEFDDRVKSYTEEQFRVLDSIQENPRSVVQGSAGTGKTVIAIESAIRHAALGRRVFLTCFNRFIGLWMSEKVIQWDVITCSHLHGYMFDLTKGLSYDDRTNDVNLYSDYLPGLVGDLFGKLIEKPFDVLIIDEAQDLLTTAYLDMFDQMLDGGLMSGKWEMYGDFEKQAIYSRTNKKQMMELLDDYGYFSKFLLKINCRNTRQVGGETALLAGFAKPPFLLEYLEGIPVQYTFYSSSNEQFQKIRRVLDSLSKEGVSSSDIVIVSSKKYENACGTSLKESEQHLGCSLYIMTPDHDHLRFATVHSFKGMEALYVLFIDIDDLVSPVARSLLYVGMSRAKYGLFMFVCNSQQRHYKHLLSKSLQQL